MRTTLVFPPQGHFTQPYLSLPSLAAYLRAHGFEVDCIDASIEAYDRFLSRDRLARSLERVRAREHVERLDRLPALGFTDMERYRLLTEITLAGEEVVERIDEAKRVLRTPELFYDYERYLWAGRTVEQGLRLFSAEYWPTRLSAHGFVTRHRIERTDEILAALDDEEENPFVEWMRDELMPRIEALAPDLVGISLTFGSQAIPAFGLAREIKRWNPDCRVVMGGGLLAYVGEKLARRPEVFDLVDGLVLLEGERPLLRLAERTAEGARDLSSVPNMIWRDDRGEVRLNEREDPLDVKTLPTPDFDDLPLGKYLSPELVLPVASTRGCYWGKCVFCTLYTVIGPGYRGRTIEQTIDDLRTLKERYGARHFYLAIEDLPAYMARRLPRALAEADLDVNWWCDARLEHEVFTDDVLEDMARAGCKRIAFGYESASPRVLERMCKGIDPDRSMDIVHRANRAGISVTLYVMVGFPTETREEARETLAAILANRDAIQEVSVRVFYLDETSEVFRRREEFDVVEVHPMEGADLQVYYDFRTSSGMSRREARETYLEMTRALRSHFPVFQNDNMLYHELKSHYFLYLARLGSWERLRDEVLEAAPQRNGGAEGRPRRREDLAFLPLAHDRAQVDEALDRLDAGALRPRYQADVVADGERARLDREVPSLPASPSALVHDRATGEVHCISPAAAELLARCDGTRTADEVVAVFPPEVRREAAEFLHEMAGRGLLEPSAATRDEVTA